VRDDILTPDLLFSATGLLWTKWKTGEVWRYSTFVEDIEIRYHVGYGSNYARIFCERELLSDFTMGEFSWKRILREF
jgi:hypothetical protein